MELFVLFIGIPLNSADFVLLSTRCQQLFGSDEDGRFFSFSGVSGSPQVCINSNHFTDFYCKLLILLHGLFFFLSSSLAVNIQCYHFSFTSYRVFCDVSIWPVVLVCFVFQDQLAA